MPELPDITVYQESLEARIVGATLERVRLLNPFVLRTAVPPVTDAEGRRVRTVERLGKRLVIGLEGDLFVVIHLMIAGRLRWLAGGVKPPGRITLAVLEFDTGRLALTEAGTKRRAALHVVAGRAELATFAAGGIDVARCDTATFAAQMRRENHTLKRALTDPHVVDGIGNAYSDEILHAARLSPLALTQKLSDAELVRLHEAARDVLVVWTERLRAEAAGRFPENVTAFRPEMAVHGKFGTPCPVCGHPVQRIVYAENECNYCAHCQTGGKILADRALSRLLHKSWPRMLDDAG
jgi:formamidopyrimidine-DNA glycosylase